MWEELSSPFQARVLFLEPDHILIVCVQRTIIFKVKKTPESSFNNEIAPLAVERLTTIFKRKRTKL